MTCLRKKLKSNSGVSILLALALMLICVMVSSVVVSSAVSGTSRNRYRTEQQRDYLAVTAAAELISNNMKNIGEFVGTTTINEKACQQYNNPTTITYNGNPETKGYWVPVSPIADTFSFYIVKLDQSEASRLDVQADLCNMQNFPSVSTETQFNEGPFGKLMEEAASYVYLRRDAYTETFTMSVPTETERLPKVVCDFTMTKNYDVIIEITSENEDSDYTILIELTPSIKEDVSGATQTISCKHRVCYYPLDSDGQIATNATVRNHTFTYVTSAPETHVEWSEPTITKEVDAQ